MRIFLYLIIVLLTGACQSPGEPARNTTLVLKDNRGTIKMNLPPAWDTALQWTHHSDCGLPCEEIKYRFQRKNFPIALEDGWLYLKFPKDSIEQLTIIQSALKSTAKDSVADLKQFRSAVKEYFLKENYHTKFVIDTLHQAGKHLIAVVGVVNKNVADNMLSYEIQALAILKRDNVRFEFKFLSKKEDVAGKLFVRKVMEVINSIQLEE